MQWSVKGLALAAAILNALSFLFISLLNVVWPGYGGFYLRVAASLYPGYDATRPIGVIVGVLYAFLSGAVSGAVLAWVYNRVAGR